MHVKPYGVVQSAGYDVYGREVFQVCTVHFRTDVTDMPFDVPNALSRTSFPSEQFDVAGVALRIVGTYQTEKGGFPGTVFAAQSPFLVLLHRPVQVFQDGALSVTDAHVVEPQHATLRVRGGQAVFFLRQC